MDRHNAFFHAYFDLQALWERFIEVKTKKNIHMKMVPIIIIGLSSMHIIFWFQQWNMLGMQHFIYVERDRQQNKNKLNQCRVWPKEN